MTTKEEIRKAMQKKPTSWLKSVLDEHNSKKWTDDAFEVIEEILIERSSEPIISPLPIFNDHIVNNIDTTPIYSLLSQILKQQKRQTVLLEKIANVALFFGLLLVLGIILNVCGILNYYSF